jgi:hypothetical protein
MVAVPTVTIAAWFTKSIVAVSYANIERTLRERIAQLEHNYSKVVVEVGKSNLVWDNLDTLIPRGEILKLSAQQFRGYSDGSYYLRNFDQKNWKYKRCTRFDFVQMLGFSDVIPPPVADLFRKIAVDMWYRPADRKINIELLDGTILACNIFPYILVQRTNPEQLRGAGAAFLEHAAAGQSDGVPQIADQRPASEREIKDTLDRLRRGDGRVAEAGPRSAAEAVLDRLVNTELATNILVDNMAAELATSRASSNVTYTINGVRKHANVFIVDSEKKFMVDGADVQYSLRDLQFFIGGYPDSLMVTASIPSVGGLSDDVPYVGEWLSNLRVPI